MSLKTNTSKWGSSTQPLVKLNRKKYARQWDEYEATEFMGSSQKETDSLGCE